MEATVVVVEQAAQFATPVGFVAVPAPTAPPVAEHETQDVLERR